MAQGRRLAWTRLACRWPPMAWTGLVWRWMEQPTASIARWMAATCLAWSHSAPRHTSPSPPPRHRPPRPGQPSTRLGHNEGVRLVEVPPSLTGSLQQWGQAPCLQKANRKSRGDACLAFQKKRKSCQNTCGEQTPRAQAPSLHKAVPLWGQTPCLQKAVKVQWPQCCISWPVC